MLKHNGGDVAAEPHEHPSKCEDEQGRDQLPPRQPEHPQVLYTNTSWMIVEGQNVLWCADCGVLQR
jgi:hypothetical protein